MAEQEIKMTPKNNDLPITEEPKRVIREIPRDEYVPPEHPNIKEIPRNEYVPPEKPEEPDYKPDPIKVIPIKIVARSEKTRDGSRARELDVIKKVAKADQSARQSAVGEIAINKVAPKEAEKKCETVFTLNCKTVTKPKTVAEKEDKIEDFKLFTKKVEKKKKAPKHIDAYEERDDKVGDMYIEKAYKTRVDEVGLKKSK